MKTIYLSNSQTVKVDDRDYEFLSQWKWKSVGSGYAARSSRHGAIYMHRVLVGLTGSTILEVDHKNGDKLDNRKHNLRVVTKSQNQQGFRKLDSRNQSGVRGVNWFSRTGKWVVRIKVGDRNLALGYFADLGEAVAARYEAERKYWTS